MAVSRQHYERAFEAALRQRRLPYVLVDDAKRAVLPTESGIGDAGSEGRSRKLKSFDAVVYGPERHVLVEIKGRRVDLKQGGTGRRECWTTLDDVRSLSAWQGLFGEPYDGVLVFLYWLDGPVASCEMSDLIHFEGRVYTHGAVRIDDYAAEMTIRSPKWGTVNLPARVYERLGMPIGDLLHGFGPDLMRSAVARPAGRRAALCSGSVGLRLGSPCEIVESRRFEIDRALIASRGLCARTVLEPQQSVPECVSGDFGVERAAPNA